MFTRCGTLVMTFVSILVLAATGCDGGGDGTGGGGSGGGGGGTGGDDPQAPVILPPNSSGQSCQNGESSCDDQAAIDEYADCAVTTCDAEYRQCFGDDYLAGTFGGPCQPLMECAVQCQDCDQPCLQACSEDPQPR